MTDDFMTKHLNRKVRITTTVGSQAFHYTGIVISISKTHIIIDDEKEGEVSIPINAALIREVDKND